MSDLDPSVPTAAVPPRAAAPDADPSDFRPAAPAAIWGMRLTAAAIALGPALGLLIASLVLIARLGPELPWIGRATWLLAALLLLLALRLAWRYAAARHARFRYCLDPRGLEIHRGVFWRSEIRVLRSRVQHTDLSRGPLERRLGLASVMIHTAGSEAATLRLPGLLESEARRVRDALLEGHDDRL